MRPEKPMSLNRLVKEHTERQAWKRYYRDIGYYIPFKEFRRMLKDMGLRKQKKGPQTEKPS